MTTTSANAKVWTCGIRYENGTLTVTSPGGGKSLTLNVNALREQGMSTEDYSFLNRLTISNGKTVDLTKEGLDRLVGLRNKLAARTVAQRTVEVTERRMTPHMTPMSGGAKPKDALGRQQQALERQQEAVNRLSGQEISMLVYDIPSSMNSECPNPSWLLWRYGFRLNLSCWVLPESSLREPEVVELLDHWKQYPEVEVHIVPYAEKALSKIRAIARRKLEQEIMDLRQSFMVRLDNLAATMDDLRQQLAASESSGEKDWDKLGQKERNQRRAVIREAVECLGSLMSCARIFEEEESLGVVFDAARSLVNAEAKTFNATASREGFKPAPSA